MRGHSGTDAVLFIHIASLFCCGYISSLSFVFWWLSLLPLFFFLLQFTSHKVIFFKVIDTSRVSSKYY